MQLGNVPNCISPFRPVELGVAPVLALFSHQRTELNAYAMQTPTLVIADRQHTLFAGEDFQHAVAEHRSVRVVLLRNDDGDHSPTRRCGRRGYFSPPRHHLLTKWPSASGGTTGTPKFIPRTCNDYYSVRRSNEICGFNEECFQCARFPPRITTLMSSPGAGRFSPKRTVVLTTDPSATPLFPADRKTPD